MTGVAEHINWEAIDFESQEQVAVKNANDYRFASERRLLVFQIFTDIVFPSQLADIFNPDKESTYDDPQGFTSSVLFDVFPLLRSVNRAWRAKVDVLTTQSMLRIGSMVMGTDRSSCCVSVQAEGPPDQDDTLHKLVTYTIEQIDNAGDMEEPKWFDTWRGAEEDGEEEDGVDRLRDGGEGAGKEDMDEYPHAFFTYDDFMTELQTTGKLDCTDLIGWGPSVVFRYEKIAPHGKQDTKTALALRYLEALKRREKAVQRAGREIKLGEALEMNALANGQANVNGGPSPLHGMHHTGLGLEMLHLWLSAKPTKPMRLG